MAGGWDTETDVLIIGGGGCGLAAAIAAHDAGAEAVIVEKLDRVGGNTALSTGSVPGAGTRFQREAGIEDSPERMYQDLMMLAGPHDCPELTRLLSEDSANLVEWLVDAVGCRMSIITDYKHLGHSVPRLHAPRSRRGQDLLDDLESGAESRGIPIAVGNGAHRLVTGDDGAVIGAVINDGSGGESRVGAGKTILATNGYAANPELVKEFCPEIAGATYFGALGSTGEAVIWGRELGADLANMAAYQGYAAVAYPQGSLLSWTTMENGAILVNAEARRFGNESAGYSGYAREVMAQGEACYAVFDERIREVTAREEEFVELMEYGGVKSGESAAEIARHFDLDDGALERSIADYNDAAAQGSGDAFDRSDFGLAPLAPPFYISRVSPGLFHTQGGLRIDDGARVVAREDGVIPNLFAGGGAAAGISGRAGGYGYASGNGLLTALGIGRIAGRTAAQELAQQD
jgi:fumarate reductase flavoprotein subunit